jgi:cell division protein YceG involved in septum cleavage
LEGFLYPDTYFFRKQDLKSLLFPNLLIKTAVNNFKNKWENLRNSCLNDKNCNPYKLAPYQVLILASIVEKEERNPKVKPYVADILIRRLKS